MSTRGKWSTSLAELNAWEVGQRRVIASEGRRIESVLDTPVMLTPIKKCWYFSNQDWWPLGPDYFPAGLEIDNTRKPTPGYQRVLVLI